MRTPLDRHILRTGACVGLCLLALAFAPSAGAAPAIYSFSTASSPTGYVGLPALPFTGAVTGTFTYDNATPQSGFNAAIGAAVYDGSFANLSGSVAGNAFSDSSGRSSVANDSWTPAGLDFLGLNADHSPSNFIGFSIGGYTVHNIRLQWAENLIGQPDFLSASGLPDALPSSIGRLFVDLKPGTGSGMPMYVYYDSLHVAPEVPITEPGTTALLIAGIAILGLAGRPGRPGGKARTP